MKAIIHAINDDNVPGLTHLLGSLNSYDVNQPNKVSSTYMCSTQPSQSFTHLIILFVLQHGTSPLLIAAGCGNIQIIEVLMRKGAEIQASDKVSLWGVIFVTQLLKQASKLQ